MASTELQPGAGLRIPNPTPVDAWFSKPQVGEEPAQPYTSTTEACQVVPQVVRYNGLRVNVGGVIYRWYADLSNAGLLPETTASAGGGGIGNVGPTALEYPIDQDGEQVIELPTGTLGGIVYVFDAGQISDQRRSLVDLFTIENEVLTIPASVKIKAGSIVYVYPIVAGGTGDGSSYDDTQVRALITALQTNKLEAYKSGQPAKAAVIYLGTGFNGLAFYQPKNDIGTSNSITSQLFNFIAGVNSAAIQSALAAAPDPNGTDRRFVLLSELGLSNYIREASATGNENIIYGAPDNGNDTQGTNAGYNTIRDGGNNLIESTDGITTYNDTIQDGYNNSITNGDSNRIVNSISCDIVDSQDCVISDSALVSLSENCRSVFVSNSSVRLDLKGCWNCSFDRCTDLSLTGRQNETYVLNELQVPNSGSSAVPFGPFTATGAVDETFPCPGATVVDNVLILDAEADEELDEPVPVIRFKRDGTPRFSVLSPGTVDAALSFLAGPKKPQLNDLLTFVAYGASGFGGGGGGTPTTIFQVIGVGDSLTDGYNATDRETNSWFKRAASRYPASWAPAVKQGYPGEKAVDAYNNHLPALQAALDADADVILVPIWFGANDLNARSPEQFFAELVQLHNAVRALDPRIKTIAITVMNRVDQATQQVNPDFNADRTTANSFILANEPKFADYVVDLGTQPLLGAEAAPNNKNNFDDGVHMTDRGHALCANVILSRLSVITGVSLQPVSVPAADWVNANFTAVGGAAVTGGGNGLNATVDSNWGNQGGYDPTPLTVPPGGYIEVEFTMNANDPDGAVMVNFTPVGQENAPGNRFAHGLVGMYGDRSGIAQIFTAGTGLFPTFLYYNGQTGRVRLYETYANFSLVTMEGALVPAYEPVAVDGSMPVLIDVALKNSGQAKNSSFVTSVRYRIISA